MLAENGASLNRRNGNGVLNGIWGALPAMWGRFCAQWAAIPYQWAQIAAARAVSPLLKMLKNRCHAVLWLSPYRCKVWKLCAVGGSNRRSATRRSAARQQLKRQTGLIFCVSRRLPHAKRSARCAMILLPRVLVRLDCSAFDVTPQR